MASFTNYPQGSIVGSGDYVFRHYGEESSGGETWYFNETVNVSDSNIFAVSFTFTVNGTVYESDTLATVDGPCETTPLVCYMNYSCLIYNNQFSFYNNAIMSPTTQSWYGARWRNGEYDEERTITLAEPATGDLLTFLQANATKIS